MINGDFFSVAVPSFSAGTEPTDPVIIADGCETNSNYYTEGGSRGTCCCGCDKQAM